MAKRFRGGKFPFKMVLAAFVVILIALLFFNMRGIREGANTKASKKSAVKLTHREVALAMKERSNNVSKGLGLGAGRGTGASERRQ